MKAMGLCSLLRGAGCRDQQCRLWPVLRGQPPRAPPPQSAESWCKPTQAWPRSATAGEMPFSATVNGTTPFSIEWRGAGHSAAVKTSSLHVGATVGLQDALPECPAEQPLRNHEIASHDSEHEYPQPDRQAEAALGEQYR